MSSILLFLFFFFFNDTPTPEIYTLSLHDALPIWASATRWVFPPLCSTTASWARRSRSEEHTSELQSRRDLVCRLLLEKKKYEKSSRRSQGNRPHRSPPGCRCRSWSPISSSAPRSPRP